MSSWLSASTTEHRPTWKFAAYRLLSLAIGGLLLAGVSGCPVLEETSKAEEETQRPAPAEEPPVTVDVAIARIDSQSNEREYTGTTQPLRQVSAKARVDGQVLEMTVDAGDIVFPGQVLARIDDRLLQAEVEEADAELGARLTEVEEAHFALAETRARVAEAEVERERARREADRFVMLAEEGAVPRQQADLERATFETAEQTVFAIEEQLRSRERAIATAEQRAAAQVAIVEREQERLSYATVISPLDGVAIDRVVEPGDVVRTGDSLLELGDFSEVLVRIEIADRDRQRVELGQSVTVALDAFPNREFDGRVARIFPIADPVARLIPVEISLSDPQRQVSGGLLARVQLDDRSNGEVVAIPRSALEVSASGEPVVFIVEASMAETEAIARPVVLAESESSKGESDSKGGDRNRVEIQSGLLPGEAYIVRSAKPLEDGQRVRRSFLSDS